MKFSGTSFKKCASVLTTFFIGTFLLFASCDNSTSTDDQELEVVGIEVTPENHTIIKGEDKKFTALAVLAEGDRIPFYELDKSVWEWDWSVTDPEIATFDNTGLATGHNVGNTICWITLHNDTSEVSSTSNKRKGIHLIEGDSGLPRLHKPFVGRDSFGVQVITPSKLKVKFNLN